MGEWTAERTDTASRLWADGVSATEIARTLGDVTRSGVIGKMHRLDVPSGQKPQHGNRGQPKARSIVARTASRRGGSRAQLRAASPLKPVQFGDGFLSEAPVEADIKVLRSAAWLPLAGHEPVALTALGDTGCKWPIGEAPFRFCNCERAPARATDTGPKRPPYCETHAAIARGNG